jgi:phage FluMu protein Com
MHSKMIKKTDFVYLIMVIQQLICDVCKKVILEKEGESYLNKGEFPISNEEATMLDKEHRGHQCHIDVVEKL